MSKRQPGKSDSTDASAHSRRVVLADSAWTAGDRVRGGSETAGYFFRKKLIWPAQDRVAAMGRPARSLATAAVVVLAAGAGVAGLIWAAPDSAQRTPVAQLSETAAPIAAAETAAPKAAEPTLQGAAPVFKPEKSRAGASEVDPAQAIVKSSPEAGSDATAAPSSTETLSADAGAGAGATASAATTKSKPQVDGPPAGAAALAVAQGFADAFLRYETGGTDSEVRRAFGTTATPELSKALLKRPPRLPANLKVPKAKVLNVVPAPSHAGVFPISVSLLRVGVTSELRLDMEKLKDDGWRVTNVLG